MSFQFPYDIASVLEPWREQLGEEFDEVVSRLADRDRALEDAVGDGGHSHDGTGDFAVAVTRSDDATDQAPATGATAVGYESLADDTDATAVGREAYAENNRTVAVGKAAHASGTDAIAVGDHSEATGSGGVAVGNQTKANDTGALAAGTLAQALDAADIALGKSAYADGTNAIAIGSSANSEFEDAVAIGTFATTTNTRQIMLGAPGTLGGAVPHRTVQGAPATAIADADLDRGQISFYLDESGHNLKVKVKYADGSTIKIGTIAVV